MRLTRMMVAEMGVKGASLETGGRRARESISRWFAHWFARWKKGTQRRFWNCRQTGRKRVVEHSRACPVQASGAMQPGGGTGGKAGKTWWSFTGFKYNCSYAVNAKRYQSNCCVTCILIALRLLPSDLAGHRVPIVSVPCCRVGLSPPFANRLWGRRLRR